MAKRTFAPQFARKCQELARYYNRHQAKIQAAAAGQGTLPADATSIVNTINAPNGWGSVVTSEQP